MSQSAQFDIMPKGNSSVVLHSNGCVVVNGTWFRFEQGRWQIWKFIHSGNEPVQGNINLYIRGTYGR